MVYPHVMCLSPTPHVSTLSSPPTGPSSAAPQIRMSQEVANFFVAEARRNLHKAKSIVDEDEMLIYNFR